MKIVTFCLLFVVMYTATAQNVVEIAWGQGINESVASPTIEIGETVRWVWSDASAKTVTSLANGSENFDSGSLKGLGQTFSYTFGKAGVTDYQNDSNPSMHGKITVASKLTVEEKFLKNLNFFPNPVKNELNISSILKIDSYQIYNVLGTLVSEGKGTNTLTQVDMSRLNSGLYFVKVTSNNLQTTLKIAKK